MISRARPAPSRVGLAALPRLPSAAAASSAILVQQPRRDASSEARASRAASLARGVPHADVDRLSTNKPKTKIQIPTHSAPSIPNPKSQDPKTKKQKKSICDSRPLGFFSRPVPLFVLSRPNVDKKEIVKRKKKEKTTLPFLSPRPALWVPHPRRDTPVGNECCPSTCPST